VNWTKSHHPPASGAWMRALSARSCGWRAGQEAFHTNHWPPRFSHHVVTLADSDEVA